MFWQQYHGLLLILFGGGGFVCRVMSLDGKPNWHWSPSIPSPAVLLRIVALLVGIILTLMVWSGTSGNQYSDSTFYAWLGSIAFWVIAFFPRAWNLGEWFRSRRRAIGSLQNQQVMYGILALLVIMGLALVFRVHRLNEVPAEITSDHVEKLLDGQRVTKWGSSDLVCKQWRT